MSKPIYKAQERPYTEDINDMIEDAEIEKGRGPDKHKRKRRGKVAIDNSTPSRSDSFGSVPKHIQREMDAALERVHNRESLKEHKKEKDAKKDKLDQKDRVREIIQRPYAKSMYEAQPRPYTEDINDLVEKGGPGSGVRGHKTASSGSKTTYKGKLIPTDEFHEKLRQGLMNYSGFSDVPGSFMEMRQIAGAIQKETGHSPQASFDHAKDLLRNGQIKQIGKVFMVMKKK